MVSTQQQQHLQLNISVDDAVLSSAQTLIGAVDQGTSSTRFMLFTEKGKVAATAQKEHEQIFPKDQVGWHEHDPLAIWKSTVDCIQAVTDAIKSKLISKKPKIAAIGITNQRETVVAWNRRTGVPYYNAIVWDDLRTTSTATQIAAGDPNCLRDKTGLPCASYFAGTKVRWLLDNVPAITQAVKTENDICFGTIDSWLVYQLTGTVSDAAEAANAGGLFITDVSNASRWLFMNLHTQRWDTELIAKVCSPHVLPVSALPEIHPSSKVYARLNAESAGLPLAVDGVPLASILGDQQAALFGQTAFQAGQAKNTYGTGLFLMMNTGTNAVPSKHGLLTTVAYQIGQDGPVHFALEGSVSHSGSTIQWLRDQLQIIDKAADSEQLATEYNDGLYFVPAFAGLFAPHWRSDARACIVGMTATHHKGHVCRAALEAAAYQTKEVLDACQADSNVQLKSVRVDGGGTNNRLLMQFQADMIDLPVIKPQVMETTSIGAAFAAGLAVNVWKDLDEIQALWQVAETFQPMMSVFVRETNWAGWKKAVCKSLGWAVVENDNAAADETEDNFEDALSEPSTLEGQREIMPTPQSSCLLVAPMLVVVTLSAALGFVLGRSRRV